MVRARTKEATYTPIPQTCTWDLYWNLLQKATGAPVVPGPLAVNGTETIHPIQSSNVYTVSGSALAPGGFVFRFGSHERWLTSNGYLVLPQGKYTFTATSASNGGMPSTVTSVKASTVLKDAKVTIDSRTCLGQIAVGGACSVTVNDNVGRLSSTTGMAYDTLTLHLASDAGQTNDFVQSYTDGVRTPPNN